MKILAWNCRGIGSSSAVRAVKEVVSLYSPVVVGLIETKCGKRRCEYVRAKLGYDCCFVVPACGRSGGLALFWNKITDVTFASYSGCHIDFILNHKGYMHVTLFYGNPKSSLRHKSWDLIRKLRGFIKIPWCIIGDFNEITSLSESTSSNLSRRSNIAQFRQVLADCGLMDLGFKGSKFTYSNKRRGQEEVQCRLDRVVGDEIWFSHNQSASLQHLCSHHSDHCPLLLSLEEIFGGKEKPFRFESMWMWDDTVVDTIKQNWNANGSMSDKLSHLSHHLRSWNKNSFGKVGYKLKRLKEELSDVRLGPRTQESAEKEKIIAKDIDEWLTREEIMWAQRSRINWMGEGDRNTQFFHFKANARRRINSITSLVDSAGVNLLNRNDIEKEAVNYFKNLFSTDIGMADSEIIDQLQCIPTSVSQAHNRVLMEPYTEREVKMALFQLYPFKAPGLDGFPAGFFQKFWNTIRQDFTATCFAILKEGLIPPGSNETLIVLIPKQKAATKMEEYRPISLTSVVSKTISKVIVNRLQLILPDIISPAQSAFVKGRLITDNYLIAHETAHFIKNTRYGRKGYGSLKLDMSKAYDRVEWRYMKLLLLRFGFDASWVSMILKYVSSVKYAICINGNNTPSFAPERGLRQGDPLSPYLFILCSEWLSYSLSKSQMERKIEGIKISRGAPFVTHLMFADDCLLLFKVEDNTADTLSLLLKNYERISGQIVNYNKSELVLSPNVIDSVKNDMNSKLSVKLVGHHDKYLGLPLSLKRQLTINFSGLIDKFGKRTENWNAKNLSAGGKEILIKAVLQTLPQYAMNCFLFPEHTIKKLHSAIRGFWWSGSSGNKPIHWVKADTLCREKEGGGLGFRDLKCINLSFLAKQAWRLYTQPDLLVSRIYKAKYCQNSNMLFCNVGYRPSYCWRSIVRGFEVLRSGVTQDMNGHINWTANNDGMFDLKSAYKLMIQAHGLDSRQIIGCSDYSQMQIFWNSFWKLAVPRKIKIFGWRGFHEGLPIGSSLHRRVMINNVGCAVCGYKFETNAHIFLHCWFARATWSEMGLNELCSLPESASFADIIEYSWRRPLCKKRIVILVTLWLLWYNRNLVKHGESGFSLNDMIYKIINQSRSFEQFESKFLSSMRFLYNSEFEWRKPPAAFIKINCDASWKQGEGGGIGIIARDNECKVLAVKALRIFDSPSSVVCEGKGLLESFKLAESLKAEKVIFETDCAEIVKWFNICPDISVAQDIWFKDSMQILHKHMEWKIFLIRREANIVADLLAKRVTNHNWYWTRLDCCPRHLCFSSV